jgi:hypothetical protein
MNKLLRRKGILFISLLGSIIFLGAILINIHVPVDVCYEGEFCGDISEVVRTLFLIFPLVFIFSVVNFKLKDEVFFPWRKFTFIYLFIYLFITIITPRYHDEYFPPLKSLISVILSCFYFGISLFIILYKSLKKE